MDPMFLGRRAFVASAIGYLALTRGSDRLVVRPRDRHVASGTEEYSDAYVGGEVVVGPQDEIIV